MKQKAILLQIEILYHVDEDIAEECYERDIQHFSEMGQMFNSWPMVPGERRIPVDFSFRHTIGEVVDEIPGEAEPASLGFFSAFPNGVGIAEPPVDEEE